jgi:carbonic anhydrase
MESRSLVIPAVSRPSRQPVMAWVAVGALAAVGVWCVAHIIPAESGAYSRVQPKVDPQSAMLAPSGRPYTARLEGPSASSSTALQFGKAPPPPVAAPAAAAAGIPWLSVTAIVLSIVATVVNLVRSSKPETVAAPTPVNVVYPPLDEERRSISNQMDQVALALKAEQARRKDLTPKQVVLELQRGNARFWSGTPERPELNAMERRALIIAQAPSVAILSCADSRVPVEILFDQGLGSMFVVRVAGNILDPTAMGSLEFSVKYLGVKVVMVMGHEACGAVKGAFSMSNSDLDKQPAYLQTVLRSIKSNLDVGKLGKIQDNRAQDREAVVKNASAQVAKLQQNPLIKERCENGTLLVCGAFYEITSGIVDFFTLDKNGLVIDV